MVKQGQGEGGQRVILVVWRCPDGCAQAAGIHVMGAGEVAHHKESPLSGVEVPCSSRAIGFQVLGRRGGCVSVWTWQAPGGPRESG